MHAETILIILSLITRRNLKFIEENWNVAPLTQRDGAANDFMSAFDFAKPARNPDFVSPVQSSSKPSKEPGHMVIYVSYGMALILAGLGLTVALIMKPRKQVKPDVHLQD